MWPSKYACAKQKLRRSISTRALLFLSHVQPQNVTCVIRSEALMTRIGISKSHIYMCFCTRTYIYLYWNLYSRIRIYVLKLIIPNGNRICTGIYIVVLKNIFVYWNIHCCTEKHICVLKYILLYWKTVVLKTHLCTGVYIFFYWDTYCCTGIDIRDLQIRLRLRVRVRVRVRVFQCVPGAHARLHEAVTSTRSVVKISSPSWRQLRDFQQISSPDYKFSTGAKAS